MKTPLFVERPMNTATCFHSIHSTKLQRDTENLVEFHSTNSTSSGLASATKSISAAKRKMMLRVSGNVIGSLPPTKPTTNAQHVVVAEPILFGFFLPRLPILVLPPNAEETRMRSRFAKACRDPAELSMRNRVLVDISL